MHSISFTRWCWVVFIWLFITHTRAHLNRDTQSTWHWRSVSGFTKVNIVAVVCFSLHSNWIKRKLVMGARESLLCLVFCLLNSKRMFSMKNCSKCFCCRYLWKKLITRFPTNTKEANEKNDSINLFRNCGWTCSDPYLGMLEIWWQRQ